MEEAFELLEALFGKDSVIDNSKETVNALINNMPINVDMVEFADACGDIDYVVEGARLAFGINGKPIADEVQRTNMAKFGPGSWVRESDGKQMKPEGWQAPDIKKLLEDQGWNGD
jgi:predicted HAD superfamily Cof-like phosphohydrolase